MYFPLALSQKSLKSSSKVPFCNDCLIVRSSWLAKVFKNASETSPPSIAAFNELWREVAIICMPPAGSLSPTNPSRVSVVITADETIWAIRASLISPVASWDAIASCTKLLAILPIDWGADPDNNLPLASYSLVSSVNTPISSKLSSAPPVSSLILPSIVPTATCIPPVKNASRGSWSVIIAAIALWVPAVTALAINSLPPTAALAASPILAENSPNFWPTTSYPPAKANQSLACIVNPDTAFNVAITCAPPGIIAAAMFTNGLDKKFSQLLSSGGSSIHIIVYSPGPPLPSLVSINLPRSIKSWYCSRSASENPWIMLLLPPVSGSFMYRFWLSYP